MRAAALVLWCCRGRYIKGDRLDAWIGTPMLGGQQTTAPKLHRSSGHHGATSWLASSGAQRAAQMQLSAPCCARWPGQDPTQQKRLCSFASTIAPLAHMLLCAVHVQTLYESAVAFGMRKALQTEQGKNEMEARIQQLEGDVKDLERQVGLL